VIPPNLKKTGNELLIKWGYLYEEISWNFILRKPHLQKLPFSAAKSLRIFIFREDYSWND